MPKEMTKLKPLQKIQLVIETDQCIACGACVAACPDSFTPAFNNYRGAHEVVITSSENCVGCDGMCAKICPSIEVDFIKSRRALGRPVPSGEPPLPDGWAASVHLSWAPDHRDNQISSSGGVLRSIVAYYLSRKQPVVCLAMDPGENTYKARLLDKIEDLEYLPGSIYHSTSFNDAIELIRNSEEPVVLMAIPCQLAGIAQYIAACEPELAEKIDLVCGIICGWMYSHHSLHSIATHKQITEPIENAKYRGGDKIGNLRILTETNEYSYKRANFNKLSDMIDYRSSFSTDFNRLRCRLCEDHTNMLADVVAGDAWLKTKKNEKISILISRTEQGETLLQTLSNEGLIHPEPASFKDVIESQSENFVYNNTAKIINRIMRDKGMQTPRFLYANHFETTNVRTLDRLQFFIETFLRLIIRQKFYKLYRFIYVFRRPSTPLRFWLRKLIRG